MLVVVGVLSIGRGGMGGGGASLVTGGDAGFPGELWEEVIRCISKICSYINITYI